MINQGCSYATPYHPEALIFEDLIGRMHNTLLSPHIAKKKTKKNKKTCLLPYIDTCTGYHTLLEALVACITMPLNQK
jgi:hypothetical protein